jgi:hypothetical protein
MFSHSSFILCSDIPNCYNAQSFSTATVFIHPSFCYSAQSFLVAIVLSYFPLLQYSIIPHATMLSHSSFATVPTISHFYNTQGRSEWRRGCTGQLVARLGRLLATQSRTRGDAWLGQACMGHVIAWLDWWLEC